VNCLLITVDSLNRHFVEADEGLPPIAVRTPSLDAFRQRATTFARHYAGSLPCMPARREFLAGIQEFLWRPWGPLEPFDQPLARQARAAGSVAQLVTDHFHYFQHGSHGYYEDYNGWDLIRGHEDDAWRTYPRTLPTDSLAQIGATEAEALSLDYLNRAQYLRNVAGFTRERDFFAPKVFATAADWLLHAREYPQWFLYVDSFEVHEPFHVPQPYASMYTDEDPRDPSLSIWPHYGRADEGPSRLTERQLAFMRAQYAGKLTMVDRWLGRVFERMDDLSLWDETMVIVTTDHGFYLGDHGWVGKPDCPVYNVLAHTPLWIWHPESARQGGVVDALTSAVDIHATVLDRLGLDASQAVHSRSLLPLVRGEVDSVRDWALYGIWGRDVNVTDGRSTLLRAPVEGNDPLYLYSTSMMNMYVPFFPARSRPDAEAGRYLPYTDTPCWRYPLDAAYEETVSGVGLSHGRRQDMLFDVERDPGQLRDLIDEPGSSRDHMLDLLKRALHEIDAPSEQFERLGL
jgi:arylsulfatase A-like enzyme